MEEDMRKLNITEDVSEDRKQWRYITHITSNPRSGKLGTINEDDDVHVDDDDDDDDDADMQLYDKG